MNSSSGVSVQSRVSVHGDDTDEICSYDQIQWQTPRLPVECNCGIPARMWEAWKVGTLYPGRRFIGCSRYKDKKAYCGYFKWYDAPFTTRSKEVIDRLRNEVQKIDRGLNIPVRHAMEIKELEREVKTLKTAINKGKAREKKFIFLLIISWVLIVIYVVLGM